MRVQQFGAMLLLYDLLDLFSDFVGQYKTIERTLRRYFVDQILMLAVVGVLLCHGGHAPLQLCLAARI